jgi:hypothetical protein
VSDARTFLRLVERARDPSVSRHAQHAAFGEIVRASQHGDVTHFVYYEFGRRMGVARKTCL